jgi:DNA modification methylase
MMIYGILLTRKSLQMRSVWSINPPKPAEKTFGKHPTQKPLELLKRCILASTAPDAIILDPFSGSSTTGIATMMCGQDRKFVGIEMEKEYLDLSIQRYNQLKQSPELIFKGTTTIVGKQTHVFIDSNLSKIKPKVLAESYKLAKSNQIELPIE